jgi:hypothetical protein
MSLVLPAILFVVSQTLTKGTSEEATDCRRTPDISGKGIFRLTGIWQNHIYAMIREYGQTYNITDGSKETILQKRVQKLLTQLKLRYCQTVDHLLMNLELISSSVEPRTKFLDGLRIMSS